MKCRSEDARRLQYKREKTRWLKLICLMRESERERERERERQTDREEKEERVTEIPAKELYLSSTCEPFASVC